MYIALSFFPRMDWDSEFGLVLISVLILTAQLSLDFG
jgi:hypothetical protein